MVPTHLTPPAPRRAIPLWYWLSLWIAELLLIVLVAVLWSIR